jgi:hypothetical protein
MMLFRLETRSIILDNPDTRLPLEIFINFYTTDKNILLMEATNSLPFLISCTR